MTSLDAVPPILKETSSCIARIRLAFYNEEDVNFVSRPSFLAYQKRASIAFRIVFFGMAWLTGCALLQEFANIPGTKETRNFVRDAHTSERLFVSHQTFNFAGEEMTSEQRETHTQLPPHNEQDFSDTSSTPEIDHPHMRQSIDSEAGAFLSSPMGSGTNIAGNFILLRETSSMDCSSEPKACVELAKSSSYLCMGLIFCKLSREKSFDLGIRAARLDV